jgi:hypothetical protein
MRIRRWWADYTRGLKYLKSEPVDKGVCGGRKERNDDSQVICDAPSPAGRCSFLYSMDKPLGPRQPDKRHAAYESIFGRPGPPNGLQGPSNIPQGPSPNVYQPYYPSQPTYPHPDRFPQPQQHNRQSYYPPQHHVAPYPSFSPGLAPPHNPALARARSINSYHSDSPGAPYPGPALTPAQAYQAQVYMNVPTQSPQPQPWNAPRVSPAPSDRQIPAQRNSHTSGFSSELPKLGISLEHDDGRLGLDFAGPSNSVSNDLGTDEGSSELPWAHSEPASMFHSFLVFTHIPLI